MCSTFAKKGKVNCQESKQIPEVKLYEALEGYIDKMDYILAKPCNVLELHLLNGIVKEVKWEDPSRKKGIKTNE